MGNDKEVFFEHRSLKDLECSDKLFLLLIAKEPLKDDQSTIFSSFRGMTYLTECNSSNYKLANTHVTFLQDSSNKCFTQTTLYTILERYAQKKQLDSEGILIAFVGQETLDLYKEQTFKNSPDLPKTTWVNEQTKEIKVYDLNLKNANFYFKYVVLPGIEEDKTDLISILNSASTRKVRQAQPYVTTFKLIEYLKNLQQLFNEGSINHFNFNAIINQETKKILQFNIGDEYNHKTLLYSPNDEICRNDNSALKEEFYKQLKQVLTTIPVAGENLHVVLPLFSYNSQIIVWDKSDNVLLSRKSVYPEKVADRVNGVASEWYTKWRKEVLYGTKNVNEPSLYEKLGDALCKKEGYDDNFKYEWVYDIEVFKDDWLFVAKSIDNKNKFVVWNDSEALREWIGNKILIGFNNAAYDDVVIRHIMAYPYIKDKSITVKVFSDRLILDEEGPKYPEFNDPKDKAKIPNFLSWDINFHMPFDIRRNSLKKLTMSVLNRKNYDSSVPFDIDRPLTAAERKDVEQYCEMDVDNTMALFLPDPDNPKRTFARDSYDIRWNLIVEYRMQAKTLINKSSSFAGKVLCGEDAKKKKKNTYKVVTDENGKDHIQFYCIPELAMKELAGTELLNFYLKNQDNPDYIHEKFELFMGGDDDGHKYQFGFGGLHQALLNYGSTNLTNMDVASLYPSLLVQYGLMSRGAKARPDSYEKVYHTRLAAKKEGKKLLNEGLKLILNGAIGAMLSEYNPLYDTWSNSSICVHGQLLVYILAKRLFDAGLNIVQTNTDGIMIETKEGVDHMAIANKWMEETRLVLEFDEIAILQQNNVNNYYCEFKNGKIKSKGFYLSNEKFGKATSKILCNIVTNKPLYEGVEPRDFVIFKRHGVGEIYDGNTKQKLDGRSLAFVVGYPDDPRTQSYYSRSRNSRMVVKKDEKGKPILDALGQQITEEVHSESKITGFTDHMLLVDDINTLKEEEINRQEYVNFAKNLLDKVEDFGPYYTKDFVKVEEPDVLQALNPLKDNTEEHPTKSGVVCQNFLFECDYMTKEEQEEMIAKAKDSLYRVVWSGNKSYHCVVRINKPVTSTAYKKVWYYLKHKLGFIGADEQCAVPSKYTRVPDQINPKSGNMQALYSFDKNVLSTEEILADIPNVAEEIKPPKEYTGKVTIEALEKHIKKQDWSDGNRFAAVQKLSPRLIAQVTMDQLLEMIPVKLEKDHKYVIRSKYRYYNKYLKPLEELEESGN